MKGINNNVKSLSSVYVLRKKFADVVVPLIAAETVSLLYLENIMSYWLQVWQHKFSQAEKATNR